MTGISLRSGKTLQTTDKTQNGNGHGEMLRNKSIQELNQKVREQVEKLSWWQCYGIDWMIILSIYSLLPVSLYLLALNDILSHAVGIICLSLIHGINATRGAHMASHNGLCQSKACNVFWRYFFCEFWGSFSVDVGMDIHIKVHHPHTNVIGLGDSSSWRVPQLPRYIYMFIAPLFLPCLSPFFSVKRLVECGKVKAAVNCAITMFIGIVFLVNLLCFFSGLSVSKALCTIFASRSLLTPSYIHVNIFQHIGMPMYSQKHRPPRSTLMSTGCLNLNGAGFLDIIFGHSLISCHLEHHLFPHLSDNMCRIVKPLVREFIIQNGMTYNEDTYWNRLKLFVKKYDTLMVNAPPITKYIGIQ